MGGGVESAVGIARMRHSFLLVLSICLCGLAHAQGFAPSRPIELVVHSALGGGSDVFARAVVEMIEHDKLVPQPIRVVNKTAGASAEAMAYLASKRGDDHTLAVFTNTWLTTPLTRKDPPHTIRDFTPVVRLVLEPTIAVVRADSPYRTLGDFVEAAKRNPGALKQAGGSVTAIESMTGLLLQSATGAKWTFISTPAVSERMLNLVAGKVDIVIPQPQDANEQIAAGRARAIAAITERRLAALPEVPTVKEQGIAMSIIANVRGIVAPPAMPAAAAAYWEELFARLGATPSWRKYVADNQVEDVFLRGAGLAPYLEEQTSLMRRVLREAGVQ
jgi:putative tricarboxylic transport membrane protein